MLKKMLLSLIVFFNVVAVPTLFVTGTVQAASAANCSQSGNTILGFPTWYKYLNPTYYDSDPDGDGPLVPGCNLSPGFPGAIPRVLLALVEIALRIAGLVAVGFVIYGGFQFILSQGEPDRAASARRTVINSLIGLIIAILATVIVSFVAGSLT